MLINILKLPYFQNNWLRSIRYPSGSFYQYFMALGRYDDEEILQFSGTLQMKYFEQYT